MSEEVTLFDLPSRGRCACWSYNPWKTRATLNYKGIPYKTHWIEYPDIKPTFVGLGIPPASVDPGFAEYSSPTVQMPDGSYIMDSMKIAPALEKLQPEPSLHLDNGYVPRAQQALGKTMTGLQPIAIPRVPERLLNEASQSYFLETRAKRYGISLPEMAKSDRAGENAWKTAQPGLEELKSLLYENEDGPYLMGKQVGYADFIIAGFWVFAKRLGEEDIFGRLLKYDEAFAKHYQACEKWLERDDH